MDRQSLLNLQQNLERSKDRLFSDEQQSPEVYNKKIVSLLQPIVQYTQNPQLPVTDCYQALITLTTLLSKISKSAFNTKTRRTASNEASIPSQHQCTDDDIPLISKDDFVRMFLYTFKSNQQLLAKGSKECFSAFMSAFPHLFGELEQTSFGKDLATRLVHSDSNDKGEYYMLDLLVSKKWVSAEFLLRRVTGDNALDALISSLSSRSIGTTLGKLIAQLLIAYRSELEGSSAGSNTSSIAWLQFFQRSLIEGMARDDITRAHIEHYVLPRIFKGHKQAYIEFIKYVPSQTSGDLASLSTVLTCLKVGQSEGWVIESEVEQLLPAQLTLSRLVAHPSSYVRLMSLELLVETSSNKRPLPRSSIECLKECLDDYFAETDPDFRSKVYSMHRYLMERLLGSCYGTAASISKMENALARKKSLTTQGDAQEELLELKRSLEDQKLFVDWMLTELLPAQLRTGSSYQRNILALKIFTLWFTAPDVQRRQAETVKKPSRDANVHFPFSLQYDTPKLRRLLVEKVMDPFEDVRSIAAYLLKQIPGGYEIPYAHIFNRASGALSRTGRASDADGVSRYIEIIFDTSLVRGEIIVPELWKISLDSKKDGGVAESIFDWAVSALESNLSQETSMEGPNAMHKQSRGIFGILGALRLIFERRDFFDLIARGNESAWIDRMLRLLSNCELIWSIVRDVLCIDSPTEGFEETLEDDVMESDMAPEAYNTGRGSHSVLNFCWRAISESSALLEAMLKVTPRDSKYISSDFLMKSGRLFLTQLSTMRHRGSLLAVSPAFLAACTRCFNHQSPDVQKAPVQWLAEEMNNIGAKSSLVTRKSAGLPMIITSVISASLHTKNSAIERTMVTETFAKLKAIGETAFTASQGGSLKGTTDDSNGEGRRGILDAPQVHALNTMRQLFLDSHLNMSMESLVPEALRISISSFSSDIWPVRNCGIMLFTTLLLRIFGSGADKAKYTLKSFFDRFVGVQDLIVDVLEKAASSSDADVAVNLETVYPALSLISRLHRISSNEIFGAMEEKIRELILRFLGSRIWKVRDAAAKAFVPLVEDRHDAELWIEVFLEWPCHGSCVDRNIAHGGLLAARYLIEFEKQTCTDSGDDRWKNIVKQIGSRFNLFIDLDHQSSSINTATYLQLLNNFVLSTTEGCNMLLQETVLPQAGLKGLRTMATSKTAGASLFKIEMARSICLALPTKAMVFLHGYGSEIGQIVAETARSMNLQLELDETKEAKIWQSIEDKGEWEPYRDSLLRLLCQSSTIDRVETLERALILVETGNMVNLQEAALEFCGKLIQSAQSELVSRWYLCLENFSHENEPHSSRLSALRSINRYVESALACKEKETPKAGLLPTYFVLYKLLNDDEDDIRNEAASVTSTLLSAWGIGRSTEAKEELTSIIASRKLLQVLSQHAGVADSHFKLSLMKLLLRNALCITSLDIPSEVSTQLDSATAKNTLLFKFEKQNLYEDQIRNMYDVTKALLSIKLQETDAFQYAASLMVVVEQYTRQALTKLLELCERHNDLDGQDGVAGDGYLGWTTTTGEDFFIIGLRCANAFFIGCNLMKTIRSRASNVSEWSNIVEMVEVFVNKGERLDESINEFWLKDFRKGLNVWNNDSQSVVG